MRFLAGMLGEVITIITYPTLSTVKLLNLSA